MTATPDTPAPLSLTQISGPDLYDLASYNTRKSFSLQTSPRFQNDRTWNLKFDARRNFDGWGIPFDLRAGASLYQLHRRKQAGQIVLRRVTQVWRRQKLDGKPTWRLVLRHANIITTP